MTIRIDTTVPLNHGEPIPLFGLGTFRSPRGGPTRAAVRTALDAGYRHIDTAAIYGNEADVGAALRDGGVPRTEVFVTTKLPEGEQGYDSALAAFDGSLERLGLDYVDLYLIHWPGGGDRKGSWRALERILDDGRARAIGVSNYLVRHLREVLDDGRVVPAVNQFEIHPFTYRSRLELVRFCRENGIAVEGYSPLAKARRLDASPLQDAARRHGRTGAQVMIRWALQHDIVTIPKSVDPDRIRENADVFDFSLDADEMDRIDALDDGYLTSWDPETIE